MYLQAVDSHGTHVYIITVTMMYYWCFNSCGVAIVDMSPTMYKIINGCMLFTILTTCSYIPIHAFLKTQTNISFMGSIYSI